MVEDLSFGVVPLQCTPDGIWEVFLVQHKKGYWSLPKGHQEGMETPLEAAKRELFEETGLSVVRLFLDQPLFEYYRFTRDRVLIHKRVGYYPALVEGDIRIQEEELINGRWVHLAVADQEMSYPEGKEIIRKVQALKLDDMY